MSFALRLKPSSQVHNPKNPFVRSSLLGKTWLGKWIILICLTVGQVQNGRRTSKNSEIFWTLKLDACYGTSLFPTMFLKDLFLEGLSNLGLCG